MRDLHGLSWNINMSRTFIRGQKTWLLPLHNKSITESFHHFLDLTNFTRSDRHPNQTDIGFVRLLTPQRCFLSTCLTANLGSDLQRGDEKAGSLTTDPFGNGRK
uniref:Hypothetical LOC561161 n=1 Tax=Nothobranchius kadleci TaxID=1051664 RepID=A0A1A8BX94_NOTKA